MIHQMTHAPAGVTGLSIAGIVLKRDVASALDGVPGGARVLAVVDPEFDGYMAELIAGLSGGIEAGQIARAALVVPGGMLSEASGHIRNPALSAFASSDRAQAESWLSS